MFSFYKVFEKGICEHEGHEMKRYLYIYKAIIIIKKIVRRTSKPCISAHPRVHVLLDNHF